MDFLLFFAISRQSRFDCDMQVQIAHCVNVTFSIWLRFSCWHFNGNFSPFSEASLSFEKHLKRELTKEMPWNAIIEKTNIKISKLCVRAQEAFGCTVCGINAAFRSGVGGRRTVDSGEQHSWMVVGNHVGISVLWFVDLQVRVLPRELLTGIDGLWGGTVFVIAGTFFSSSSKHWFVEMELVSAGESMCSSCKMNVLGEKYLLFKYQSARVCKTGHLGRP